MSNPEEKKTRMPRPTEGELHALINHNAQQVEEIKRASDPDRWLEGLEAQSRIERYQEILEQRFGTTIAAEA